MKNTDDQIAYYLYARKSSEEDGRQAASIDDQVRVLTSLADRLGLAIAGVYREAHSAKEPNRRRFFAEMTKNMKVGKARGVLCWKLDRLARNPDEAGMIIGMLQRGEIQHIKTSENDYRPDDDAMLSYVQFGLANQYIRNLSRDVRRGLYERAKQGIYPAPAPIGYLNDPAAKKGNKMPVPDPERWDAVRRFFDLMLTGAYTVDELWRKNVRERILLTKKGKLLSRASTYRLFTSRFYYGEYEYPRGSGQWYHAKHKPMITPEEYDRIQAMLGRKGKPRPHTNIFDFTGMIRCGTCDAMVTAEIKTKRQKNGNIHIYTYYHCSHRKEVPCRERSVRDTDLMGSLTQIVDEVSVPPEFHALFMEWLRRDLAGDIEYQKKAGAKHGQEHATLTKEKHGLIGMRARGEISEDDFKARQSELNRELARLDALIAQSGNQAEAILAKADEKLVFAVEAKKKLQNGTREERREVLANLGSHPSLKAQRFNIYIEKPLLRIRDVVNALHDTSGGFTPPGTSGNTIDEEQIYASNLILRKGRDSNSRYRFRYTIFPGSPVKPLLHPSSRISAANPQPSIRRPTRLRP